ncbi:serine-enriched protein isoform X2 [Prorops nasuta]|uniref:serine-enriched protein isoform X2 n=1 Tax=Prorops nasuta TaxID=863751 RepID=UPI0034CFC9C9
MPEASGSMISDEFDYSTFENKSGLADDMKFLARMPELCDVTFLVGDTREPVCAVKAVLAARSRVFHKMLYTAPSPQRKKEPQSRENKIRLFLKRSSEPLLNLQNAPQQPQSNQHHTVIVEEFEPDVFRQLIEYIHTGCVTLQPRTLLGVMNAADYYGLDELRRACAGFVQCCITVDTVCALLASAERYIQYKCTKSLVQKVLEFVDEHGNEVLNLGSFTLLPQHVVRLILAREELRADEFTKYQAALMWSKKYCDTNQKAPLKDVIGNFLEYIQFHKIPANVLMREVHPLGLVPNNIIMNALAYQADPTSVDPGKLSPRVRRQGRSMSVQSTMNPYGSNTTLSSSGSDVGSDEKPHSALNQQEHLEQLHQETIWLQQHMQEQQERAEQQYNERQRKKLEQENLEAERKEQEKVQTEKEELEKIEQEREERERLQKEKLEQERLEKEKLEAERVEKEKLEAERLEKERLEAERLEKENLERQKLEQERLEQDRLENERLEEQKEQQESIDTEKNEEDTQLPVQPMEEQPSTQEDQQQQPNVNPTERIDGLYIRLVLRQEGRANLVWLYKTHKF